ncbi:MAG: gliding motility-associated C-terminal domain-containing protein [Prolixibacteraceae bacterium]|nr:gliding motility-associated C-terminal domain-containing protein [Prolixibacteraceae bacterium]
MRTKTVFSYKVLLTTIVALCFMLNASGQGRHIVLQGAERDYRVAQYPDVNEIKWAVFTDDDFSIPASETQVILSQGTGNKNNEVHVKWLAQGDFYLMVTMTGSDGCPNKKAWPFTVEPPVSFIASAYCDGNEARIRWETQLNEHPTSTINLNLYSNEGILISSYENANLSGSIAWPGQTKSTETPEVIYATIDFTAHFNEIPETDDITIQLFKPDCTLDQLIALNDSIDVWHNTTSIIHILNNDYDTAGRIDSSSVQIVSYPENGELYLNQETGLVEYKPNICFFDTDSFSYYIMNTEQEQSNIAKVSIHVKINPESDMDNDGIPDIDENLTGSYNLCDTDTDMDGIPNFLDPDDDGDEIATIDEPGDLDGNGIPDYLEAWHSAAVDDYAQTGIDIPVWISVLENDSSTMVAATLHIDINPNSGYSYIENNNYDLNYTPDFDFMGKDSLYYVVCDHYGICDTAKVLITVEDLILPPEVFTPNNDGFNESFVIENLENYPDNQLVIFNRWGNKVYEQNNYQNDWAGHSNVKYTLGDKPLPVGVYYYVLKYANNRIKQGGVYLER